MYFTPHRLDQVLLATHQPVHVYRASGGGDPREPGARIRGHVAGLGGREQRLGRNAPVFTHVPPNVPRSIITTDFPSVVARIAAANAAPPDPITARSNLDGILIPPWTSWNIPLIHSS
jgi:hypothetical protein